MATHYDPQGALLTFALVLTGAAGIGLVAWLLITVAEMAQQYAAAAGAGGISLTLGLRKGK
ncbi:hypothetical protein ACPCA8_36175 [Streptomyces capoamus]|uniref:hypothetical protein n=1 Tax=Streptomyces capoamus TaxID=68183 RepID=UPI003C2EB2FD